MPELSPAAEQRPVVVGVDGSLDALDAVRAGAREAFRRGAPLELVLAFPWPAGTRVPAPGGIDGRAVFRTMAELALEAAASTATAVGTREVRTRIVDGSAVDVLATASAAAQLLCVGTRGAGGLRDLVLGSTAAALLHSARCPVLLVPRRPAGWVDRPSGVVVGLSDGSLTDGAGDRDLVPAAFAAADARGCGLLAVHARPHREPGPGDEVRRREEAALDAALDGWPDRFPAVPVRRVVEHARPADALVALALTAELVVVGHRQRRFLDHLGSVAHAVVHRAACPVLVVPLLRAARTPEAPAAAAVGDAAV